jgi:hypothetical protein
MKRGIGKGFEEEVSSAAEEIMQPMTPERFD